MHKPEIWILFADAARARVVRRPDRCSAGEGAPLQTILEATADPRPLRDIMSDAPGRSFASTGARRSAMAYHSDPVRDETRKFAQWLIATLTTRFAAGEFDQLVICAPPRMLNALRDVMTHELKGIVRSETAKDFTKTGELELRRLAERLTGLPD